MRKRIILGIIGTAIIFTIINAMGSIDNETGSKIMDFMLNDDAFINSFD